MTIRVFNPELGSEMQTGFCAAPVRGLYRETTLSSATLVLAVLIGSVLAGSGAEAQESKYQKVRRLHPDLFEVYYDENVMAYCGLLTPESETGFRLERDALLMVDPLDADAHRDIRVASNIAVDYAYQDHGLSGQKHWCGTEGLDAYNRFVARYRRQSPATGNQTQ